jgi:error-prone DNA polymerase
MSDLPDYAELHTISNFTFLSGASHPEELVRRAHELAYTAIAITDECSLSGVVRAHIEAQKYNIKLIIGSEFKLEDGLHIVLLATCRKSYGRLSQLITRARRQAQKGRYCLSRKDIERHLPGDCLALWRVEMHSHPEQGKWIARTFPDAAWVAVNIGRNGKDSRLLLHAARLAERCSLLQTACGSVTLHHPSRRALRDVLTAIRLNTSLCELGFNLPANAEQHLRPRAHIQRLYPAELIDESIAIADRCNFSMEELRYEYPDHLAPEGQSLASWLKHLSYQGAQKRWPQGMNNAVQAQIEAELKLISELHYEPYFLTVYDIVRFARNRHILCQGRGSAANSAVCYCLGITEVDPDRFNLLFERFISRERDEPPDIDVDFEHERREEVIQYLYRKYGRDHAALVATVITYQPRSAIRDIGKALGFSLEQVDRLARTIRPRTIKYGATGDRDGDGHKAFEQNIAEAGFEANNPRIQQLLTLVFDLLGFPRHLSQHVGGFVISRGPLNELVPIENTAMPERTVIQWEKDDLEALGLLKVDVLALGMLSAIRKCFDYVEAYRGERLSMSTLPAEDPKVYGMIQKADTIGVFQIESRAQMSMLPRLKPANFYDLVIEIAIVRPGPIQGDMVHPYLKRRQNPDTVQYPSKALESVLERTLGVPIFQEQVMQIAMVAAGFSAGEADQLRRAMAAWKRKGGLEQFRPKLLKGMLQRGYEAEFAEQIFHQIKGFGDYGFPESHSASFALLAYVSSWLKYYEPAAFCCALLNSQPMGFYRPAQLVKDAERHGVTVNPVDINVSVWDCQLETGQKSGDGPQPALRLGMRMVKGLSRQAAQKIVRRRYDKPYAGMRELVQRTGLNQAALLPLAAANALSGISGHRYQAYWQVAGIEKQTNLWGIAKFREATPLLKKPTDWNNTLADYASTGLTLGAHPLKLLRKQLGQEDICTAERLVRKKNGQFVRVAGLVLNRQRPGTASGVVFITLEDETGHINLVIWPKIAEALRKIVLQSELMFAAGQIQIENGVIHLIVRHLRDDSHKLGGLQTKSRDFH